ncbi:phosphate ABC transporter permease subunit PstC [Neopusillimonas maritima]|jgi:phosphate transport system permease protein|uniref:Phosphate transport system permease protein n=1 Tax=Neopusillimonas maritima TaxID=2026239 RepID=A0ABX9MZJ2_9BURK|nr:phosphate ABC transporter permease subunit PstC [Neopusillimonas maritima]MAL01420.1 phosphate ABC transporter permease subunit PstC [Alcaligenaceae bacterium]RII82877.1 phosphate ABC transporter permease subunit PstC [Neopusillimonas maritima]|tara:strand:- start:134 stop:1072 length:939 start_codon:yes stop_codon:yes gene_type:complete
MKTLSSGLMDLLFKNLTRTFAFLVFILLAAIMVSLIYGSRQSISEYGFSFLWTNDWNPVEDSYGALVPIVGTLLTSVIALIIAVPISFGIAMFLTELAPNWLKRPLGTAIEMLAAIPSIIYGMWGLFVFVPIFQSYVQPGLIAFFEPIPVLGQLFAGPPFGIGVFTAGLILSIMIIPFISAVMRDVFELVPPLLKESAYGLGGTTWEVVWKVILPYTKHGVVGGIMLGLGRALGETMAVTFVIGNSFNLPESLFAPSNSIASALANEFNEAGGMQKSALLELGLILFLITTVVLAFSKLLLSRLGRNDGVAH